MRLAFAVAALSVASALPARAEEARAGKDAVRARVASVAARLARNCDLFDGTTAAGANAEELLDAARPAAPSAPPAASPTPAGESPYKEVATPAPAAASAKPAPSHPLARVLEGTRNLAHRVRITIQRILEGTRNL